AVALQEPAQPVAGAWAACADRAPRAVVAQVRDEGLHARIALGRILGQAALQDRVQVAAQARSEAAFEAAGGGARGARRRSLRRTGADRDRSVRRAAGEQA